MSLFNSVAGHDPLTAYVMATIFSIEDKSEDEIKAMIEDIPRFRDAYVLREEGENILVLMTRTGGGNREDYAEQNQRLREIPGFIRDEDDNFDQTFAHWYYSVPEKMKEMIEDIIDQAADQGYDFPTPMQRFQAKLESL